MKTAGYQIDTLCTLLKNSDLNKAITGKIYKVTRPNSGTEDIVIHSLSLVGQRKQFGSAVVNIWVPDKDLKDQLFPDTKRIDVLSALAISVIEAAEYDDFNMTVAAQSLQDETVIQYHFFSITVNFEFFNI